MRQGQCTNPTDIFSYIYKINNIFINVDKFKPCFHLCIVFCKNKEFKEQKKIMKGKTKDNSRPIYISSQCMKPQTTTFVRICVGISVYIMCAIICDKILWLRPYNTCWMFASYADSNRIIPRFLLNLYPFLQKLPATFIFLTALQECACHGRKYLQNTTINKLYILAFLASLYLVHYSSLA